MAAQCRSSGSTSGGCCRRRGRSARGPRCCLADSQLSGDASGSAGNRERESDDRYGRHGDDRLVRGRVPRRETGRRFARAAILDLVDQRLIRVLDALVFRKGADGALETLSTNDLEREQHGLLGELAGATSGLIDADDSAGVGEILEPGSAAADDRLRKPLVGSPLPAPPRWPAVSSWRAAASRSRRSSRASTSSAPDADHG